jgi:hypothetical protein
VPGRVGRRCRAVAPPPAGWRHRSGWRRQDRRPQGERAWTAEPAWPHGWAGSCSPRSWRVAARGRPTRPMPAPPGPRRRPRPPGPRRPRGPWRSPRPTRPGRAPRRGRRCRPRSTTASRWPAAGPATATATTTTRPPTCSRSGAARSSPPSPAASTRSRGPTPGAGPATGAPTGAAARCRWSASTASATTAPTWRPHRQLRLGQGHRRPPPLRDLLADPARHLVGAPGNGPARPLPRLLAGRRRPVAGRGGPGGQGRGRPRGPRLPGPLLTRPGQRAGSAAWLQAAHTPAMAWWVKSGRNPWSRSTSRSRFRSELRGSSRSAPQREQVRWACWTSSSRW